MVTAFVLAIIGAAAALGAFKLPPKPWGWLCVAVVVSVFAAYVVMTWTWRWIPAILFGVAAAAFKRWRKQTATPSATRH